MQTSGMKNLFLNTRVQPSLCENAQIRGQNFGFRMPMLGMLADCSARGRLEKRASVQKKLSSQVENFISNLEMYIFSLKMYISNLKMYISSLEI